MDPDGNKIVILQDTGGTQPCIECSQCLNNYVLSFNVVCKKKTKKKLLISPNDIKLYNTGFQLMS